MPEVAVKTEEKIDITDLQLIKEKLGIDIRELAKQAKAVAALTNEEAEKQRKERKETTRQVSYSLIMAAYPDFIIQKKTKTKTTNLVVMPSCKGYYTQVIEGQGKGEITKLTKATYVGFMSDLEAPIKMPEDFWLTEVEKGADFYRDCFTNYLEREGMSALIKEHISPKMKADVSKWNDPYKNILLAYRKHPLETKEAKNNEKVFQILNNGTKLWEISEKFGLDNYRDFCKELNISLVNLVEESNGYDRYNYYRACNTVINNLIPTTNDMGYAQYKEYVLYTSVKMGYANSMRKFFDEWKDSLDMQIGIYGKIKEKYPKDLPIYHNILVYKKSCLKEQYNEKLFEKQYDKNKEFEFKCDGWVFISPKIPQDMLDEAAMQANCLASYIDRHAAGESSIFFMRKAEEPDRSVVTIEVKNNVITQAYQEHNRLTNEEQKYYINKWCEKTGIAEIPYKNLEWKPTKEEK